MKPDQSADIAIVKSMVCVYHCVGVWEKVMCVCVCVLFKYNCIQFITLVENILWQHWEKACSKLFSLAIIAN